MSTHDDGHGCQTPEHTGSCGQPDDMEAVQRRIDRRKLELTAEEFAAKAREHRERLEDDGVSRRSVLGGAAGLAAAGFLAPVAFSETADAHGTHEPIYTTGNLNVRSQPTTGAGVVKTAQEGTGMIIESGPYSNDGHTWWEVRVNGCGNDTSRVEGYVAEDWTAHPNFSYGTWGSVSSIWGDDRSHGYHRGIDIANDRGTPIFAARQGTVTYAGWASGYGNVVYIDHGNGYESRYAHLSEFRTSQGAWVSAGERIGDMGCTGTCTGDHLHFEIRRDGSDLNWPQVRHANQWLNTAIPRNFPGISGAVYPGYPY
ncbi:peptidoglycan DD-metalloendopeptidase family protein [Natrononativus amylolyticus]|uniref:peptidoglycan DD-metalloendopeptidase family protein n=1 Tax=Natrononativus amylolyticus TaxID=2963434 RepID=UPI0020CD83F4|nr:peptidoglycan DD-metalloendopeptidase family protein [Natrononativus amylolyticus]